jgi:hypothetical protein
MSRTELLHVLLLPTATARQDRGVLSRPAIADLRIDLEKSPRSKAVLVGKLREGISR